MEGNDDDGEEGRGSNGGRWNEWKGEGVGVRGQDEVFEDFCEST